MLVVLACVAVMPRIEVEVTQSITTISREELHNVAVGRGFNAADLSLPGVQIAPAPASDFSGSLQNAVNYCIDGGSSTNIGPIILNEVIEVQIGVRSAIYGSSQTVNPNINVRPGGVTLRTYGVENVTADALVNVYQQPGGTLLRTFPVPLGTYHRVPANPLFREEFFPDGNFQNWEIGYNNFGGLKFGSKFELKMGDYKGLYLPTYHKGIGKRTDSLRYGIEYKKQFGNAFVDDALKRAGTDMPWVNKTIQFIAPQGKDMNAFNLPGTLKFEPVPDCGSQLKIPPGAIWIPDKDTYQTLINIDEVLYNFPVDPSLPLVQQRFRTSCLDMKLKEPELGVRYYPFYSRDPMHRSLAKIAFSSSFRGPWDQGRTWIYTDRASRTDINRRLVPGVTQGLYLQGLYDVTKSGGFGAKDFSNTNMFVPELFGGSTASQSGATWFTSVMAEYHGKSTRQWFESNPQDFSKLLNGGAREQNYAAITLGGLLSSFNPDARIGALKFLKLNPTPNLLGKIGSLQLSLYGQDNSEVETALDVLPAVVTDKPTGALRYLSTNGKTDAIRKKAAALMGN